MVSRTYIPNNRYSCNGQTMSRVQKDLSSSPHQGLSQPEEKREMLRRSATTVPRICVVGAGVAGLRCADILLKRGAQVTILEARDRVGGRVCGGFKHPKETSIDFLQLCQGKVNGHMVDLGPNWIHGTEHNPILDMAKETKTATMSWDGRQAVFDPHGKAMLDEEALQNTELVWTIIEEAMKYSNDHNAEIPVEKSLYDFFAERLQKPHSYENDDAESKRKRDTILQMAEMWGAFVGSPIQSQSLKYFWLEECIDGENLFVAETYHKVLSKAAEPALSGADIKFGTKVTAIVSKGDAQSPKVVVKTHTEQDLTFDEVVMTTPLGWLKRNIQAFTPSLPERLKEAIAAIGYGNLDKAYITFPEAFWNEPSDVSQSQPMHQPSVNPNVTATAAPLNQPSDSTIDPAHYPGFTLWTSPHYAESSNPAHWNQEAVNLAALPSPNAHPTLLFYTHGPTSLHLTDLLRPYKSPSDPEAQRVLSDFFKPYYSRLPNYSASNPAHQPSAILATLWANDEFAGFGSYSNFQTGLERGDEDIEVMRYGLPERGVWLAGEHTAPFVALGTVTGAYWAGEGVAKRILKAYGLGEDEKGGGMSRMVDNTGHSA
ncbi:FAD/NAD(P)-binding domain-containing protein [Sporormia fimetaria CBS 119925]|uniref:FAD/NAD(P)-binding domain-containing protein n=1 Tax=Sporormia fimetaria CBS 119925 TaxID=1340428 RepID=A0A6A6VGJ2_9PLEO|nr:FAD/NAD(P)-binding domain-containing protein [Sporormia fimetaria CBS 119925]